MWGVGTDSADDNSDVGVISTGVASLFAISRHSSGSFFGRCNSNTSKSVTNANSIKHYAISRGGAASYDRYFNLTKTTISDASTGLPIHEMYGCGRNTDGTSVSRNNRQLRYIFLFSYLSESEVQAVMNITEAYLDNYGKGLL
jgi:hypothetical protein